MRLPRLKAPHFLIIACLGTMVAADVAIAQIEQIVVTATRREQSVLEVPVAVSAYSGDFLRKSGVDDIQEIANLAPSFQASTNSSETQGLVIRIRGIGTQGNNPAFESAVGVFIDGIYRSRAGAALTELLDVDRIEVLRGPQGTLFGRNTSAGALSIVTAGPEFEFGGYGEISYERADLFGDTDGVQVRRRCVCRPSGSPTGSNVTTVSSMRGQSGICGLAATFQSASAFECNQTSRSGGVTSVYSTR